MSIINEATGACTRCGTQNTIKIYKSINVADCPELKDRVKDGSLFLWECPHCGQVNLARYGTLYHDPEKKLMVWLVEGEDVSETQMQAIANHTKAMGGYTLRIVPDMGSLMEKVLIMDAGLEDTAIEMCKYVTKMEMASKLGDNAKAAELFSSTFHFYRTEGEGDDRLMTFMYPLDGKMLGINIGINVYYDCLGILERNPHAKPGDGFIKVDSSWIDSIIR
ncbi:MAG: CpXC domain-containing protein [Bacteroidales bacterium]|nr:CpXC domain-containing protein [Bacteroides sp.]MCM1197430.1 CpXC domain-containing protein [Clostridium sp.]MCM1502921.1 CpXC domain-containing protein [Bacteroidales bacterium]